MVSITRIAVLFVSKINKLRVRPSAEAKVFFVGECFTRVPDNFELVYWDTWHIY